METKVNVSMVTEMSLISVVRKENTDLCVKTIHVQQQTLAMYKAQVQF